MIFDPVILAEITVKEEVEQKSWTRHSQKAYWTPYENEVLSVTENGNAYTKVASASACESTPSSFFYSTSEGRLYIHTSGSDSPDTKVSGVYKYCILTLFYLCFANKQFSDSPLVFVPSGATVPIFYLPFLSSDIKINQSVGDFYLGNIVSSFSRIKFLNDGWFYTALRDYYFQNAKCVLRMGKKGDTYSAFRVIFNGIVRNPEITDDGVEFELKDMREARFVNVPIQRFSLSTYPKMDSSYDGKIIPILFGEVKGITPILINSETQRYKVSIGAIEDITAVFLNGVPTTNFTKDLTNGEFVLTEPVSNRRVQCNAKGVKCGANNTYSQNVADILLYVLKLNGIPDSEIDLSSFQTLRTERTQKIGWYLNKETHTIDFVRMLQLSALFQTVIDENGRVQVKVYKTDQPIDDEIIEDEIQGLSVQWDSEGIFQKVVVKYAFNPSENSWLRVEKISPKTLWRFGEGQTLEIESALWDSVEANSLAEKFLRLVQNLRKFVAFSQSDARLLSLIPTSKIQVSKEIRTAENRKVDVLFREVFRIFSISKDIGTLTCEVKALEEASAVGEIHSDAPHVDFYADSHSDVPHSDVSHGDAEHLDVPHSDIAHDDLHGDSPPHGDIPHEDSGYHLDEWSGGEEHLDYTDHVDVPHEDVPHEDYYFDTPHSDHPYQDAEHLDTPHQDVRHTDTHEDTHDDVPHSDSSF